MNAAFQLFLLFLHCTTLSKCHLWRTKNNINSFEQYFHQKLVKNYSWKLWKSILGLTLIYVYTKERESEIVLIQDWPWSIKQRIAELGQQRSDPSHHKMLTCMASINVQKAFHGISFVSICQFMIDLSLVRNTKSIGSIMKKWKNEVLYCR